MKTQRGFSLIEVLVSLLVLAFGVLGMAGMQSMGIYNTELGRYNSRAAIQAGSIAAAMKADVAYWGTPPTSVQVQGSSVTGGPATYNGTCVYPSVCTPAQLAYYDLATWGNDIATNLPGGTMAIACNLTVSPAVCTVTISWFEKNMQLHNPAVAASGQLATGTVQTHSYQTLVSVL